MQNTNDDNGQQEFIYGLNYTPNPLTQSYEVRVQTHQGPTRLGGWVMTQDSIPSHVTLCADKKGPTNDTDVAAIKRMRAILLHICQRKMVTSQCRQTVCGIQQLLANSPLQLTQQDIPIQLDGMDKIPFQPCYPVSDSTSPSPCQYTVSAKYQVVRQTSDAHTQWKLDGKNLTCMLYDCRYSFLSVTLPQVVHCCRLVLQNHPENNQCTIWDIQYRKVDLGCCTLIEPNDTSVIQMPLFLQMYHKAPAWYVQAANLQRLCQHIAQTPDQELQININNINPWLMFVTVTTPPSTSGVKNRDPLKMLIVLGCGRLAPQFYGNTMTSKLFLTNWYINVEASM
jgi:hypothetical protein